MGGSSLLQRKGRASELKQKKDMNEKRGCRRQWEAKRLTCESWGCSYAAASTFGPDGAEMLLVPQL